MGTTAPAFSNDGVESSAESLSAFPSSLADVVVVGVSGAMLADGAESGVPVASPAAASVDVDGNAVDVISSASGALVPVSVVVSPADGVAASVGGVGAGEVSGVVADALAVGDGSSANVTPESSPKTESTATSTRAVALRIR